MKAGIAQRVQELIECEVKAKQDEERSIRERADRLQGLRGILTRAASDQG